MTARQLTVHLPDGGVLVCDQLSEWHPFETEGAPLSWCEARGLGVLRIVAVRHRVIPCRLLGASVERDEDLDERDAVHVLHAHGGVHRLSLERARVQPPRKEPWFRGLHASGMIRDGDVTAFLSQQTRIPTIDLGEYEVAPEVIALVSCETCERLRVLPVSRAGGSLIVAMVDPKDEAAKALLREATGFVIEPVIASAVDIAAAIARYY